MRNFTYRFLLTLVLCSLVSFIAFARLDVPLVGIDDANIYFVYASNVASGHGFVYNAGGERVEGFTSLLWTLIVALTFKLSAHPEMVLVMINIALLSAGIAVALTYLDNDFVATAVSPQHWRPIVFLVLMLTSPRYIVWNTLTLMENGLWSTLLLVTTILVIKYQPSAREINLGFIPFSILLLLTRPESILWVAVFVFVLFIRRASAQSMSQARKELTSSLLSPLICIILLTFFRLQYFGYPLPNTFYAKVSPSFLYNLEQGAIYLSKYIISDPVVLLSVAGIVVSGLDTMFRIFSKRIPNDGAFFLPIIAGTGLLAPLLTGGDHFGSFRLYQNIFPIEILCLFYFANRILPAFWVSFSQSSLSQAKRRVLALGSTLAFILGFFSFQFYMWDSIKSEINIEFKVADYGRKNGAFIQGLFSPLPKLPSLGVVTSGGIKYSYNGEIVDLMGLNNTVMAHNQGERRGIKNHAAFDIETFYQLQPDIVWPLTVIEKNWQYSAPEIKASWENREGLKGLFDEPHFLDLYTYAKVSSKSETENRYVLIAWFKKDLLKQLSANSDFHVEKYDYSP